MKHDAKRPRRPRRHTQRTIMDMMGEAELDAAEQAGGYAVTPGAGGTGAPALIQGAPPPSGKYGTTEDDSGFYIRGERDGHWETIDGIYEATDEEFVDWVLTKFDMDTVTDEQIQKLRDADWTPGERYDFLMYMREQGVDVYVLKPEARITGGVDVGGDVGPAIYITVTNNPNAIELFDMPRDKAYEISDYWAGALYVAVAKEYPGFIVSTTVDDLGFPEWFVDEWNMGRDTVNTDEERLGFRNAMTQAIDDTDVIKVDIKGLDWQDEEYNKIMDFVLDEFYDNWGKWSMEATGSRTAAGEWELDGGSKQMVEMIVGRMHVATPDDEVAATIRRKISKDAPEEFAQNAIDYALQVHHGSFAEYEDVMGGGHWGSRNESDEGYTGYPDVIDWFKEEVARWDEFIEATASGDWRSGIERLCATNGVGPEDQAKLIQAIEDAIQKRGSRKEAALMNDAEFGKLIGEYNRSNPYFEHGGNDVEPFLDFLRGKDIDPDDLSDEQAKSVKRSLSPSKGPAIDLRDSNWLRRGSRKEAQVDEVVCLTCGWKGTLCDLIVGDGFNYEGLGECPRCGSNELMEPGEIVPPEASRKEAQGDWISFATIETEDGRATLRYRERPEAGEQESAYELEAVFADGKTEPIAIYFRTNTIEDLFEQVIGWYDNSTWGLTPIEGWPNEVTDKMVEEEIDTAGLRDTWDYTRPEASRKTATRLEDVAGIVDDGEMQDFHPELVYNPESEGFSRTTCYRHLTQDDIDYADEANAATGGDVFYMKGESVPYGSVPVCDVCGQELDVEVDPEEFATEEMVEDAREMGRYPQASRKTAEEPGWEDSEVKCNKCGWSGEEDDLEPIEYQYREYPGASSMATDWRYDCPACGSDDWDYVDMDAESSRKTAAVYEDIVFAQGDDAEEPLRILDEDGEDAAIDYLSEWDMGASVDWWDEEEQGKEPWGTEDRVYEDPTSNYVLNYNERLGYIGLSRKLSDQEIEDLGLQQSPDIQAAMKEGIEDIEAGRTYTVDELRVELSVEKEAADYEQWECADVGCLYDSAKMSIKGFNEAIIQLAFEEGFDDAWTDVPEDEPGEDYSQLRAEGREYAEDWLNENAADANHFFRVKNDCFGYWPRPEHEAECRGLGHEASRKEASRWEQLSYDVSGIADDTDEITAGGPDLEISLNDLDEDQDWALSRSGETGIGGYNGEPIFFELGDSHGGTDIDLHAYTDIPEGFLWGESGGMLFRVEAAAVKAAKVNWVTDEALEPAEAAQDGKEGEDDESE